MNDSISRQAALRLFDRDKAGKYWGRINNDTLHEIWNDLKTLPSAEQEVTGEMVNSYLKSRHLRVISEEFYMHLTTGKYLPPPIFQPTQPERKKGKWIQDSIASNIFRCSECGYDAPVDSTAGCEIKSNFCPWCGADMRGEEE